ncbi:death-on-curing protein [Oceaniferula spumae]|uniref:Death-on-curing protein n=1 Tax=Oceaniferula spumae TaxID=2979115 RepID=A0AAT9FS51_9BACT
MGNTIHPSLEQILRIHQAVLAKDGGSDGIREMNLLESALAAPRATFGGAPIMTDPVEIAAAYLYYLCNNHPFVDGNKRVALATCLVFLKINGVSPKPDSSEWERLVIDVASSAIDRALTTERLRLLLDTH